MVSLFHAQNYSPSKGTVAIVTSQIDAIVLEHAVHVLNRHSPYYKHPFILFVIVSTLILGTFNLGIIFFATPTLEIIMVCIIIYLDDHDTADCNKIQCLYIHCNVSLGEGGGGERMLLSQLF